MTKRSDQQGTGPDGCPADTGDVVGARGALPFRLERLGGCRAANGNHRSEAASNTLGTAATRPAAATPVPDGQQRHGPNSIDAHVGSRIRQRRRLLGMSQTKLAIALGITFQQLQKYEQGQNRITAGRLFDLGRVLDMSISSFFDDQPADSSEAGAARSGDGRDGNGNEQERSMLQRRETLNLIRAYYTLEDPAVRNRILDLVESLGTPL